MKRADYSARLMHSLIRMCDWGRVNPPSKNYADAIEFIRLRDIARTFDRAGIPVPVALQKGMRKASAKWN